MTTRTVVTKTHLQREPTSTEFGFLSQVASDLAKPKDMPAYLLDYRRRAWEAYQQLPMPTTQQEAWRRTNLKSMPMASFHLPQDGYTIPTNHPIPPKILTQPIHKGGYSGQIVISPQGVSKKISPSLLEQGVIFTDLVSAREQYPDILGQILGTIVPPEEGKFAALTSLMAQQGILVYVPRGVQIDTPVHSLFWGPGKELAYFSHLIIWLEERASLTYIHEAASPKETNGQSFHAGIVEILVNPAAELKFVEIQSWGEHVWNFGHERARIGRDANLEWIIGAFGSHLTKNFSELDLVEQGAKGRMSGIYFTNGVQHIDYDTQQNHRAPQTTSDLIFKGVLRDRSRSVWQGMIYVAPGAQKTDGYQANRNLVLNSGARADSIPGLEILADDVRCTHGATVGKIDAEQLFYLQSRGIPFKQAERLIVEGFFEPILQRIPFEGAYSRFRDGINAKMVS